MKAFTAMKLKDFRLRKLIPWHKEILDQAINGDQVWSLKQKFVDHETRTWAGR